MKILLVSSLVLGLTVGLGSAVEKMGILVDNSKVTYNVTEDKKLSGPFLIEDVSKVTRLRGNYVDDKRSGDWYCFDSKGDLVLRYNYTADKLLSLNQNDVTTLAIKVLDKDVEVATNARIPVPICSVDQYKAILIEELKDQIPQKYRTEKATVSAEVTALVDAEGNAKYFANYVIKGVEYKANLYIKDKIFDLDWLPAKYKDNTYKSEVKFSSTFQVDPGSTAKRFIWNY